MLSFTPTTMTYKVIITMTDAETGEILSSNKQDRYLCFDRIKPVSQAWFDSLLRGISQGRELSLMITIRNKEANNVSQLDIF